MNSIVNDAQISSGVVKEGCNSFVDAKSIIWQNVIRLSSKDNSQKRSSLKKNDSCPVVEVYGAKKDKKCREEITKRIALIFKFYIK